MSTKRKRNTKSDDLNENEPSSKRLSALRAVENIKKTVRSKKTPKKDAVTELPAGQNETNDLTVKKKIVRNEKTMEETNLPKQAEPEKSISVDQSEENKSNSKETVKNDLTIELSSQNPKDQRSIQENIQNESMELQEQPIEINKTKTLPPEFLQKFQNASGKLMIAGNVAWDSTNKSEKRNELLYFNRFTDAKYRAVFSGPTSAHSILITEDYKAFSFGRNQSGQCGQEKLQTFYSPVLIKSLKNVNVIQAACGHNHTLFLTDTGTVYACGDSKFGQLGIRKFGNMSIVTTPSRIYYDGPPICKIGCGGEFSVILDIEGNLYTFGHPEYGQLGNASNGQYFNDRNKLVFGFVYTPTPVKTYIEKDKGGHPTVIPGVKVVDFACGKNHTVVIDSEKRAFSFGFGGYGRLGHNVAADELQPRLIKYLNMTVTGGATRIYCGTQFSLVISGHNLPYVFGKNKNTSGAEARMYPKVVEQLCGFGLKSIGCSVTSIIFASVENKLIAWGSSPTFGELGIGTDPKSSAQPTFVESMNNVNVISVAMGLEHSMVLVNTDDADTNEKYLSHSEYTPVA